MYINQLTVPTIERIIKRIENPANWLQGVFAKDAVGRAVQSTSETACRFCSAGARNIETVSQPGFISAQITILFEKIAGTTMVNFNDTHTHAEVMQAWTKTLNLAKQYLKEQDVL